MQGDQVKTCSVTFPHFYGIFILTSKIAVYYLLRLPSCENFWYFLNVCILSNYSQKVIQNTSYCSRRSCFCKIIVLVTNLFILVCTVRYPRVSFVAVVQRKRPTVVGSNPGKWQASITIFTCFSTLRDYW